MNEELTRINRTLLAEMTGMHVSVISRFLTGQRVPDFHQARKMADALGVPLDELYRLLYAKD